MQQESISFSLGVLCGIGLFTLLLGFYPQLSYPYNEGVRDAHKDAFANGLMTKEIDKDDKVIYRWVELHKLESQDN
jgi:hypothetical protein